LKNIKLNYRMSRKQKLGPKSLLLCLVSFLWFMTIPLCAQQREPYIAFKSGEQAQYSLYYNWNFIWVNAGMALLHTEKTSYQGESMYKVKMMTKGSHTTDRFFVLRDTLTSIIDRDVRPYYYSKYAHEGKDFRIDEIHYSYTDTAVHLVQSRLYEKHEPYHGTYQDTGKVYDMLSFFMWARSIKADQFKMGERINFKMATGRKVEKQTIIYQGRRITALKNKEKYACMVFSFVEKEKGKSSEHEVVRFYVTDDKNHLPIRLDMFLSFGTAKAFLDHVEGHKYPFTSKITKP